MARIRAETGRAELVANVLEAKMEVLTGHFWPSGNRGATKLFCPSIAS